VEVAGIEPAALAYCGKQVLRRAPKQPLALMEYGNQPATGNRRPATGNRQPATGNNATQSHY